MLPATKADPLKKVHWFKSLAASLASGVKDLHFIKPEKKHNQLTVVLLDTSASTVGRGSLANAKGAIVQLAQACYFQRSALCLMTFGNERIETVLHPQRAPKQIEKYLDKISAGGGTPLRKALLQIRDFIEKQKHHYESCKLYILTDGRSRDSLENIHLNCEVTVVDTENSTVKLGLGKRLADALHGHYIQMQALKN